jgi:glycosyltransferase involved in cell wall biosynthesis/ribosomal protein S18 acetylase RimI-like enzyme
LDDSGGVTLRSRLRKAWFGLRGIDPEAVIVTFRTGPVELCDRMAEEVRRLIPGRRHIEIAPGTSPREVRERLRGLRIGMAPVMIAGGDEHGGLRRLAFRLAPTRILAYNPRLERHHLQWKFPLASWLFWRGTPLDRIWLRPSWWPWARERTVVPREFRIVEGRPFSPVRAPVSVLSPYVPWPMSHGGAVRLYNLLRECSYGFDITLFAFTEGSEEEDLEPLRKFCTKLVLVPKPRYREPRWSSLEPAEVREYRSDVMEGLIAKHRRGPLQVEFTQLAGYGGDILVEHDITFDLYRQVHRRKGTVGSWWDWWRWRRFEKRALKRAGHAVVMSDKDRQLCGHRRATVIPNGVDLTRFRPAAETGADRILFIGSFRHFPNVVAYRFLTGEVFPRVRARKPGAQIAVVAGPDPRLHWQASTGLADWPAIDGVEVTGFVADVRPLYEESKVAAVPTLESAGTNVKVLEAMAMGRPVVSTSSGCAGLGLVHGLDVWIADGAAAFADGIVRMLADEALRRGVAERGRRTVEERFSWRRIAAIQTALWSELSAPPVRLRGSTVEDAERIAGIIASSPEAGQWKPDECTVAVIQEEVVGLIAHRTVAEGEHEILNLAVAPEWRRKGVARVLVANWLNRVKGDVFLEVRESNVVARRFYEALGFSTEGVRSGYYDNPPEAGIVMRFRTC